MSLGISIFILVIFAIVVLIIASIWKLYTIAGREGWASIVPIYNSIVMLEIGGKPAWWVVLMFIPYIGAIWSIWSLNMFIKAYGKDEGFTVGVIFLPFIFLPILAFSDDTRYVRGEEEDFFSDDYDA